MNLGGIKVGSVELEGAMNRTQGVIESAAVAVSPQGGGPAFSWHQRSMMSRQVAAGGNPTRRKREQLFTGSVR
jgi:hypothetical protein